MGWTAAAPALVPLCAAICVLGGSAACCTSLLVMLLSCSRPVPYPAASWAGGQGGVEVACDHSLCVVVAHGQHPCACCLFRFSCTPDHSHTHTGGCAVVWGSLLPPSCDYYTSHAPLAWRTRMSGRSSASGCCPLVGMVGRRVRLPYGAGPPSTRTPVQAPHPPCCWACPASGLALHPLVEHVSMQQAGGGGLSMEGRRRVRVVCGACVGPARPLGWCDRPPGW